MGGSPVDLLHLSHFRHVSLVQWTNRLLPATGGSDLHPGGATHTLELGLPVSLSRYKMIILYKLFSVFLHQRRFSVAQFTLSARWNIFYLSSCRKNHYLPLWINTALRLFETMLFEVVKCLYTYCTCISTVLVDPLFMHIPLEYRKQGKSQFFQMGKSMFPLRYVCRNNL
jgi:hypothetical protein